jgi:hypothetical protein
MKTKHLIILAIALCVGAVVTAILLEQHRLPVTPAITNNASNSLPPANPQPKAIASTEISEKTNTPNAEGYSMKLIDSKTGQCAFVGLDEHTITLKDKNGNVLWTVNLANEASKAGLPIGHIQGMEFDDGRISKQTGLDVSMGRASFFIDIPSGRVSGAMH